MEGDLQKVIFQSDIDPVTFWKYAERYLTLGARTYSPFSQIADVDKRYHPQLGERAFPLESFWLNDEMGSYFRGTPSSELHDLYQQGDSFLFVVHPNVLNMPNLRFRGLLAAGIPGPLVEVTPSANTRTLFVNRIGGKRVPNHFLKVHFPRRISRFVRELDCEDIKHQLWVSGQLIGAGVPVLPDVAGGVLGWGSNDAWGYIVREATPMNLEETYQFTVPFFALYSRDVLAPNEPPLIAQIICKRKPAVVLEEILRGLIQMWILAFVRAGCVIEPHAQNTLFLFSERDGPFGIAYRDADVYVRVERRENISSQSDLSPINVIDDSAGVIREQILSLTFDSFLCHHSLAYLNRAVCTAFGLGERFLPSLTKSLFSELGGNDLGLPATTFSFSNELFSTYEFRLVDTKVEPVWR